MYLSARQYRQGLELRFKIMKILVSDVNEDCKTTCGKFLCFLNKHENIDGIKKKVYAVEIETGLRILNPDFKVNVKHYFAY